MPVGVIILVSTGSASSPAAILAWQAVAGTWPCCRLLMCAECLCEAAHSSCDACQAGELQSVRLLVARVSLSARQSTRWLGVMSRDRSFSVPNIAAAAAAAAAVLNGPFLIGLRGLLS